MVNMEKKLSDKKCRVRKSDKRNWVSEEENVVEVTSDMMNHMKY